MLPLLTVLVGLLAPQAAAAQAPAVPPAASQAPLAPAGKPISSAADEAGVRAAVDHYFQGHATGDASHMRLAFLPTAHIEGLRNGAFVSMTLDQYCSGFTGKPAADEAARRRTLDLVEISGTSAIAKATLVHGAIWFTDAFVLLKVDGQWRIANKVFTTYRTQ
jgi:hypothetical protein